MLRVLYAGSPGASAKTLKILLDKSALSGEGQNGSACQYKIVGVLTNPPSAQGRHSELIPTDVEKCARDWNESHGYTESDENAIAVFTPEHLDSACRDAIAKVTPDIFVCFAYGHIFGPKFLASFKLGGINLHPSLLPKYRGCTPVNQAILNGDRETGYSIQKIALATDEGDIIVQKKIPLDGTETAESLLHLSAEQGADSLHDVLCATAKSGALPPATPQSGEASYCDMIKKEDGKIDWNDSAKKIDARIRAYTPWPGCYTDCNGVQLRILKGGVDPTEHAQGGQKPGTVISYEKSRGILIQCGEGVYIATELQLQAKKAMDYKSFMNGARDFIGTVLGVPQNI